MDSNILLDQGNDLPFGYLKTIQISHGELTFRRALETSNLVTLKISLDLGLNSVIVFDKINFYNKTLNRRHSTLLGAVENNILNLTKSYSIFLNGGYIVEPSIIKKVVSNEGN